MTAGKDYYLDRTYEKAFARYYVATNAAMMEYPFMVGRYDECSPTLATQADEYILDSAIGDPSVGNEDVLEKAEDIGADIVVCADVLNDTETTTERVLEMFDLVEDGDVDKEVMIPIQHDDDTSHVEHYDQLAVALSKSGVDIDEYRLMLGGLKESTEIEKIRSCIDFREHVGLDTYVHALGVGGTREWIATIRQCPWLLDSFDNSSIVQNLVYRGRLLNLDGEWIEFRRPRGTDSTAIAVQFVESSVDMFNYMIGEEINEEDAIDEILIDAEDMSDDEVAKKREIRQLVQDHREWHRQFEQSSGVFADVNA